MIPSASPSTRKSAAARPRATRSRRGRRPPPASAMRVRQRDDAERVRPLRHHPAGHHHIGPLEVGILQGLGVAVDEAALPRFREQRGDRDQPERRRGKAGTVNLARGLEIPERPAAKAGATRRILNDCCIAAAPQITAARGRCGGKRGGPCSRVKENPPGRIVRGRRLRPAKATRETEVGAMQVARDRET